MALRLEFVVRAHNLHSFSGSLGSLGFGVHDGSLAVRGYLVLGRSSGWCSLGCVGV